MLRRNRGGAPSGAPPSAPQYPVVHTGHAPCISCGMLIDLDSDRDWTYSKGDYVHSPWCPPTKAASYMSTARYLAGPSATWQGTMDDDDEEELQGHYQVLLSTSTTWSHPKVTDYSTDEHNNLEMTDDDQHVWATFANGAWVSVIFVVDEKIDEA